ncbi:TetR family transcriptional regulator, partial [Streptomyces sp. NPDC005899]|uniref:TetR/AcrR family transcriptional regulator n=1 Tax=Streptomyces sp. NPDC005899 TaxID=3155716 RepID=UPI0033DAF5AB
MPSAREALLESAHLALSTRPWAAVRMVDVAASAGVSRQNLHNEFGGKHGLAGRWSAARAPVRKPRPSGEYGTRVTPSSTAAGTALRSTS